MKIAFIGFWTNYPGGLLRRICRVYSLLCSQNENLSCDILLVGRSKRKEKSETFFNKIDCSTDNLRIIRMNAVECLFLLLFTNRYSLVHFWGNSRFPEVLQRAMRIKKQKALYTVCDYRVGYDLFEGSVMKRAKRLIRNAEYIDLLYPAAENFIRDNTRGRVFITPGTFTDLKIFKPANKEKIMVYAAARLEDSKNPILLVKSVNLCRDEIRKNGYRVIVLGDGEYKEYLKSYIRENDLSDIVVLAEYQKTSKYLPSAEVFFSLQKNENYPSQSLAEAVACGCYSIITDVGDSRKCATEQFASFVEETDAAVAMAIIKYFSMGEDEKRNIINSAREFALQNYSIDKIKDYYMSLIDIICE